MNRFEAGQDETERLREFHRRLWEALVPSNGPAGTLQGELIRCFGRLSAEYVQNGMGNAVSADHKAFYGSLETLMLDTLIANRGSALSTAEVDAFVTVRKNLEADWVHRQRSSVLTERDEVEGPALDDAEQAELAAHRTAPDRISWEPLFDLAERCIANRCLANPELVELAGRPSPHGKLTSVDALFCAPAKCPLCGGRGFVQPDEAKWPKRCSCQ